MLMVGCCGVVGAGGFGSLVMGRRRGRHHCNRHCNRQHPPSRKRGGLAFAVVLILLWSVTNGRWLAGLAGEVPQ